jgi:hypothetical protein
MRPLFFFLMILISFKSFEQYREVYSGISLNNYHWSGMNTDLNQQKYTAGFQIGIMASPKLKFIRGIGKGLISPYASFEYTNARAELASHDIMQIHAVRAALPTRVRVFSYSKKRNSIYALIEPGVNFSFLQTASSRLVEVPKINPVDFYLNAGLGSTISIKQKEVLKAGYKCSGISINTSKYLPISLFRSANYSTSGLLDQFRFNVGIRFTYMEPEKKKSSFFRRLFGKD